MSLYLGSSQKLEVNIVENVVGDDSGEKTYLYNGVELPALPEWNRTAYPYVVIYKCIYDDYYTMRVSSNPCYVTYSYIMFGIGHNNLYWDERNMFLEFRDFVQQDGEFSPGIQNLDDVNFLWTNIAICYADNYTSLYDGMDGTALDEPDPLAGTIYLEAGVLEEVLSTTQISTSWHMRYPMPIKQPTAYFYGHVAKEGETPTHTFDGVDYVGEILPKLPEWDETVYPYAVISTPISNDGTYFHFDYAETEFECRDSGVLGRKPRYGYKKGDESWREFTGINLTDIPVWANFDLYYASNHISYPNELCIARSKPIQVYE